MSKWIIALGILFWTLLSVYNGPAALGGPADGAVSNESAGGANAAETVRMLTGAAAPTTAPSTQPASFNAPHVSIADDGTVEIHCNNADIGEVLRMLSLQSQKNIVASSEVHGGITANLYGVTLMEALDAVLHANGFAYRQNGKFIYVYSAKELADLQKSERVLSTQVFHLYYTPAAAAAAMIKPALSTDAQVAMTTAALSGLTTGATDTGGDSEAVGDLLVVTDYQDNLDKVRKILKEVDHRPVQILVEATILSATLTEDNAMGIDFTVMGGVNFNTLLGAPTAVTAGEVLNGTIINDPNATAILKSRTLGGAGTGFAGNVPPGGLQVGVISNNLGAFLSALETVDNTVILANPKILALDKQKGEVIVGREDGYLTTTVTQTSTVQTVDFLDTGTRLIFRPYVGEDGYIRMEIHPEDSSGGLTSANLPFKNTTEVTTNVLVKDGYTVVIGGMFREDTSNSRSQVPFLGNLPLAGPLFRSVADHTQRQEVIIFLTPHIVQNDAAFSAAAEQMLKAGEKLRVGVRKGMMPFGRERLAESYYDDAQAEMNQPHPDRQKALWDLDCATNLNPTFLEAIEMKEKISGKTVTSVDNSSIRTFVKRMVMTDSEHKAAADKSTDQSIAEINDLNREIAPPPPPAAPAPAAVTAPVAAAKAPTTQPSPVHAARPSRTDGAAQAILHSMKQLNSMLPADRSGGSGAAWRPDVNPPASVAPEDSDPAMTDVESDDE